MSSKALSLLVVAVVVIFDEVRVLAQPLCGGQKRQGPAVEAEPCAGARRRPLLHPGVWQRNRNS